MDGDGRAFHWPCRIFEMLWVILGSVLVVIAAGCSIRASRDSRRDINTGRPSFYSVADATGIWSRTRLDQLLGPRDTDDRYTATSEQVYGIPQAWWKRFFDNDLCSLACILLAIAAPFCYRSQTVLSIGLLAISGSCVVISYVGAVVVILQSGLWDERA